jgi:hypothetical protein
MVLTRNATRRAPALSRFDVAVAVAPYLHTDDHLAFALTCSSGAQALASTSIKTAMSSIVQRREKMHWALAQGAPVKNLCVYAARAGNYEMLIEAFNRGAMWTREVAKAAAQQGHVRLLIEISPWCAPIDMDIVTLAIENCTMYDCFFIVLYTKAPFEAHRESIWMALNRIDELCTTDNKASFREGVYKVFIQGSLETEREVLRLMTKLYRALENEIITPDERVKLRRALIAAGRTEDRAILEWVSPALANFTASFADGDDDELIAYALRALSLSNLTNNLRIFEMVAQRAPLTILDFPGALAKLIDVLHTSRNEKCCSVLSHLAKDHSARVVNAGAIPVLIEMLRESSHKTVTLSALARLANAAPAELFREGIIPLLCTNDTHIDIVPITVALTRCAPLEVAQSGLFARFVCMLIRCKPDKYTQELYQACVRVTKAANITTPPLTPEHESLYGFIHLALPGFATSSNIRVAAKVIAHHRPEALEPHIHHIIGCMTRESAEMGCYILGLVSAPCALENGAEIWLAQLLRAFKHDEKMVQLVCLSLTHLGKPPSMARVLESES